MHILGINAFHADASAAMIRDGALLCAAEEERFNRIKHCAGLPAMAVQYCLEEAGIRLDQVDHIAISRDPKAHLLDKILYTLKKRPNFTSLVKERLGNALQVKDVKRMLCEALGADPAGVKARVHNVEHHRAHIASTFFVSPFPEAAVLSIDGFGDFVSTMWGVGRGNRFRVENQVEYPHSLGIVYTAITQWLGFRKYGDEGKVMGLAPYGVPKYLDRMRKLASFREDGTFELDLEYFIHHTTGVSMTWDAGSPAMSNCFSPKMVELFGAPRNPGEEYTEHVHDVAASLQAWLEESIFSIMNLLQKKTGQKVLCLAGGVALNSCTNGKIFDRTDFTDVFIQPAAGDNGTSVGAAFFVWNQLLGNPRGFVMEHAYTGPRFDEAAVREALARNGLGASGPEILVEKLPEDEALRRTANAIANGKVVGFFQGRMEFGPRALGNRSILGDPRRAGMKDILNSRIKHREPFRPFAPSVLEEHTAEYFERGYPSPTMLMVYKVRAEKRSMIPAVVHVDDTGRLQTVSRRTNPRYWGLIEAFRRITGVPVVLNTSFNENEPIVCSPGDAIACFLKTRMDVLTMGNWYIERLTE
jgi:carbamoyltransferase